MGGGGGGYDEIVDIWGHHKMNYFGGHFLYILGLFLRSRYRIGIFLELLNFKYVLGMSDIPDIFGG